MNILHAHDRDIPEQKDETEEDQAGKYQESDEDSLLGFNVQSFLRDYQMSKSNVQMKQKKCQMSKLKV